MLAGLLVATLAVGAGVGSLALQAQTRGRRASSPVKTTAPVYRYQTEQEWIVWQTVRTIAAGAAASEPDGTVPLPPIVVRTRSDTALALLNAATMDVRVGNARAQAVSLAPHVWSPSAYVPFARTLLAGRTGAKAGAAGSTSLLEALTTPTIATILQQEARVTAALKAAPLDPVPHEEAALLTATLAWREAARWFSDLRPLLCRTTAHLALARALAPDRPAGPSAIAAAIVIDVLAGREDLALQAIDAWRDPTGVSAIGAWKYVLHLRATGD
jgi:hypothetical protein